MTLNTFTRKNLLNSIGYKNKRCGMFGRAKVVYVLPCVYLITRVKLFFGRFDAHVQSLSDSRISFVVSVL